MNTEMLRLLGGSLLAASGALLGYGRFREQKRQKQSLELLCSSLGRMAGELTELNTPLPELFEKLEECPFFLLLSAGFGGEPLEQLWRRAAGVQLLPQRDRALLASLGAVIGKYEAERQTAEISLVRQQLSEHARELEREMEQRGRHYAGLGAALGAMLAVMLL